LFALENALRQIVAICILMIGVCLYLHTVLLRFAHHQMQEYLLAPDEEMLKWNAAERRPDDADINASSDPDQAVQTPAGVTSSILETDMIDP
jgi:hypothetical protein